MFENPENILPISAKSCYLSLDEEHDSDNQGRNQTPGFQVDSR
jgi:hypothetical protein